MVKVNNFSFGSIIIDNRKYHHDVLIFADGAVEQRQGGIWIFGSHNIKQKEIEKLLKDDPEVVISGTGTSSKARLSPGAESRAKEKKLELAVPPSYESVTKLNELTDQGKKVSAIIHVTC